MNLYEVVMKLVGPVCPTGDHNTDQERLKNMKALTELVDRLLFDIGEADQGDVIVPVEKLEQDLEQYITLGSTGCRTIAEDVEFNRLHSKFLAAFRKAAE